MKMLLDKIESLKIVPVIVMNEPHHADRLADVLISGGLPCAEITFRTDAAAGAIAAMSKRGGMLVGAGTILSVDQVKSAVDSGAQFIVSPGLNPKVVSYCIENGILITPGVCTPSDIEAALDFGLDVLKFFPAEAFGGLKTLKALSGPYRSVRFIPTGGVTIENLESYLSFSRVLACGGSWLAKTEEISKEKFDDIFIKVQKAVNLVMEMKNR